jgi:hypothetical protein
MRNNIVHSERGMPQMIVDNYKLRIKRRLKNGNIKWECTNNRCTASIMTDEEYEYLGSHGEHEHPAYDDETISRHILKNSCKLLALQSPCYSPESLIRAGEMKMGSTLPKTKRATVKRCLQNTVRKYGIVRVDQEHNLGPYFNPTPII